MCSAISRLQPNARFTGLIPRILLLLRFVHRIQHCCGEWKWTELGLALTLIVVLLM
jgi:hypothetical protein